MTTKRINSRAKGSAGEREICKALNAIILEHLPGTDPAQLVQRNQQQTAVGGCDLINTLHFAIEVKRAETLQTKKWWQQCRDSAERLGRIPVLIYRSNRQSWTCLTYAKFEGLDFPCAMGFDEFCQAFRMAHYRSISSL